jgi:DNA-binding FrmR family transcriptional regulator
MEKIHSKALDNTAKVIFVDHMGTCLVDAVHHGNEQEVIQELKKA